MSSQPDVKGIAEKIAKVKTLLDELNEESQGFPAISRNSQRALASVKMLELNISDLIAFDLVSS